MTELDETERSRVASNTKSEPRVGAAMPVAKIYVTEGQYDEPRLERVSVAVQDSLRGIRKIPPDDYYQIIYVLSETGTWTRPLSWV